MDTSITQGQRVHMLINSVRHEWQALFTLSKRLSEEKMVWCGELTTICLQYRRLGLMLGGAKTKYIYIEHFLDKHVTKQ